MNRKRVVFCVGPALGHVARTLLIAQAMLKQHPDIDVHMLAIDKEGYADRIAALHLPVTSVRIQPGSNPRTQVADRFEEFFAEHQPDLICLDMNPLWVMEVRFPTDIPQAFLANWFMTAAYPGHTPFDDQFEEQRARWNQVRRKRSLPEYDSARDLYEYDSVILLDPPFLLDGLELPSHYRVAGPCDWEPPSVTPPEIAELDEYLFVAMGSTGFKEIPAGLLDDLADAVGVDTVVSLGTNLGSSAPVFSGTHLTYSWLPADQVTASATAVLTHGGTGTVYQAMKHGVPAACWPTNRGHLILAEILDETGYGVMLEDATWTERIARLHTEMPSIRSSAHRAARSLEDVDGPALAASALIEALDHAADPIDSSSKLRRHAYLLQEARPLDIRRRGTDRFAGLPIMRLDHVIPVFIFGDRWSGLDLTGRVIGAHPAALLVDEEDGLYQGLISALAGQSDDPRIQAAFEAAVEKYRIPDERWEPTSGLSSDITHVVLNAPRITYRYPKLLEGLPRAKVLFPVRDSRDVIASMGPLSVGAMIGGMTQQIRSFKHVAVRFRNELAAIADPDTPEHTRRAHLWSITTELAFEYEAQGQLWFRYEDLVASRESVISRLLTHVGLSPDRQPSDVDAAFSAQWTPDTNTLKPTVARSVGIWSDLLTGSQEADVWSVTSDLMERLGYRRDTTWTDRSTGLPDRPKAEMSVDRPIVATGRGGSGTRLLSELLELLGVYLGPRNRSGDSLAWVDLTDSMVIDLTPRRPESDAGQWRDVLRERAEASAGRAGRLGATEWGWKLPETMLVLPEILETFPEARLIHMVRDPVDISLRRSHKTSRPRNPVGRVVLEAAYREAGRSTDLIDDDPAYIHNALSWVYQVGSVTEYARTAIDPSRCLEIRYEDVTSDPVTVLHEIAAFLGIEVPAEAADLVTSPEGLGIAPQRTRVWARPDPRPEEVWEFSGAVAGEYGYEAPEPDPPAPPVHGEQPRILAVLGMHRSGTTVLTGMIEEAGLNLGPASRSSLWSSTLTGTNELASVNALQNDLLEMYGSSWSDPPAEIAWTDRHRHWRDLIVAAQDGMGRPWAFKDPRTILMLDGWLELGDRIRLIGVVRHPLVVADSLIRRDRLRARAGVPRWIGTPQHAIQLWMEYNQRLLEYHDRLEFPIVMFGAPTFAADVSHGLSALGFGPPGRFETFDPDILRSAAPEETLLEAEVLDLYHSLQERAARWRGVP